jgi:hypothetical protein
MTFSFGEELRQIKSKVMDVIIFLLVNFVSSGPYKHKTGHSQRVGIWILVWKIFHFFLRALF